MSRERNPKDFYENRVLQLQNNTPLFGKRIRRKVIEEICQTKFVGWYSEKISALAVGLNHPDKDVSTIAENYLLDIDKDETELKLISSLCEYYVESKDPRILKIIRKKNYTTTFDNTFKKVEFDCSVHGIENCQQTIVDLSIEDSFKILQHSSIPELKEAIQKSLHEKITPENLNSIFDLFMADLHYSYCEYIDKHITYLTFAQKIQYIQKILSIRGFDGSKESLMKMHINNLHLEIKQNPSMVDAHLAIKEFQESMFNDWILELLVKNRPILGINNELALCNHFKEYDKVRDMLMKFSLEELCLYYPYFVDTPIECMFAQKLRMAIKKQSYNFNFNLLKNFFEKIEENLKIEIFKMLSNFSIPVFYDFILFQIDKIANYSPEEQKIFLEEIIPFYIPMFSRLNREQQENTIKNLPDMDPASLAFLIHSILKMRVKVNMITYLEKLFTVPKFGEDKKLIITEILINHRPEVFEESEILAAYKPVYEEKIEEVYLLLGQLEYQCGRQYLRDDRTGHNEDIDRCREQLIKEIKKVDLEKVIEILLPHYSEKNYRLKRDVKKILLGTKVGYRYLIPYALTSAVQDKDLRDFAATLLKDRITPYLPFKPTIKVKRQNQRYIELFIGEKDLNLRELAKCLLRCNIETEK